MSWRHFGTANRSLPYYGPPKIEIIDLESSESSESSGEYLEELEDEDMIITLSSDESGGEESEGEETEGADPVQGDQSQEHLIEAAKIQEMEEIFQQNAPLPPSPPPLPPSPPPPPPPPPSLPPCTGQCSCCCVYQTEAADIAGFVAWEGAEEPGGGTHHADPGSLVGLTTTSPSS